MLFLIHINRGTRDVHIFLWILVGLGLEWMKTRVNASAKLKGLFLGKRIMECSFEQK